MAPAIAQEHVRSIGYFRGGPVATDQFQAESVIDGRYRVIRELGSGGQAIVLLAEHVVLRRLLALRIARSATDERAARVYDEAATLAHISHPNIIRIDDAGRLPDGRPYTACEWIDGQTLTQLSATGQCGLLDALEVVIHLADAVATLHGAGIIHRDLKPGNVLVPCRAGVPLYGTARLIDFGVLGHLRDDVDGVAPLTPSGRNSGTALYSAPEQALGRSQSRATDVFSLGAMLFALIYRYAPMAPNGSFSLFTVNVAGQQLDLPVVIDRLAADIVVPDEAFVPPSLRDAIARALRNNPQERTQSAALLRDELRLALADLRDDNHAGAAPGRQSR
jgi:eukaryotic-like serine/threonine-protein kinase